MTNLNMNDMRRVSLEPSRYENGGPFLIAGLGARCTAENMNEIFALWQRFAPHIGSLPGQIGRATYGVVFDEGGGLEYLAGVEVSESTALPAGFRRVRVPAQRYAVFSHLDHVSTLRKTVHAIWDEWLPRSGHVIGHSPEFFERYGEAFDPQAGSGDVEIWVPLER